MSIVFFLKSFKLWLPLLMIVLYYQTKTSIDFWCKRGLKLNSRSLIQSSITLRVKLTGTHKSMSIVNFTIQGPNNLWRTLNNTFNATKFTLLLTLCQNLTEFFLKPHKSKVFEVIIFTTIHSIYFRNIIYRNSSK